MTKERFVYPKPQNTRIGIKVRWYYYKDKADAEKAAEVARREAPVREAQGYDFGYQSPGSIHKFDADQGGEYAGLYEVTLP